MKDKKIVVQVADVKARVAERQAPAYFVHPEFAHPNGDDVIVCAPAEMTKDLVDRGFKVTDADAFEKQGKTAEEKKAADAAKAPAVEKK